MLTRLRSSLLAVSQLRGSERRDALFLLAITLIWSMGLGLLPFHWTVAQVALAALGPALTIGGYMAGMLWPYWRVNWIVRLGALETGLAAIWLWGNVSAGAALVLTWQPLTAAIIMLLYHERWSIYTTNLPQRPHAGDRFPDFTLPDSNGATVNLANCLAEGPALFLFYRGDW